MQMNTRSSHPRIYGPRTRTRGPKSCWARPRSRAGSFWALGPVTGPYMRGCDERELICICIYVYMYVYIYICIYLLISNMHLYAPICLHTPYLRPRTPILNTRVRRKNSKKNDEFDFSIMGSGAQNRFKFNPLYQI